MLFYYKKPLKVLCFLLNLVLPFSAISADKAPNFTLPTATNKITLQDQLGKVVYVDFWASWCKPCRTSFPWMNQIQTKYQNEGLVIIAINLDKDPTLVEKFLNQYKANFAVAFDPQGTTAEEYKVIGMPSSFLIKRDGSTYKRHTGFRDGDGLLLEKDIRDLLKM